MLSCKEISKLVSESLDHKLTLRQRMEMWMHLRMCRLCSAFRRDLLRLRNGMRQHGADVDAAETNPSETDAGEATAGETSAGEASARLSAEARQRIKRALSSTDR
ncbi:hypothetical protein Pla52o_27640 [Novipirellula galeiformis]|uniref:Putative zinc-finger domain-containing protein n=1 Tax=Novipirellula galeiformis TaxID=2528004 RepID=A0A5C6CG00_9BACT|nr:zf-HC2 domain-containing protein [Novipirellula galeiformis]TWU23228.1 hypothetical protein Pla52o_27640 [Novipirellula galeiformis]